MLTLALSTQAPRPSRRARPSPRAPHGDEILLADRLTDLFERRATAVDPRRLAPRASGSTDEPPPDDDREGELATKPKGKVERPRRFKVLLHNDDYTTMEFVVLVLMQFFHKSEAEATHVMLSIHHQGSGVAGVYPRDVAESKVQKVTSYAREHGMPLRLTAEPE